MIISLPDAVMRLENGEVVAIPTDTVYGLSASLKSRCAVGKVYELKKRSKNKPLSIHVHSLQSFIGFCELSVVNIPHVTAFVNFFWPGAVSIVVDVKISLINDSIRAGMFTAAFRIPNNDIALYLLRRCGPLISTSANLSGEKYPITAEQVECYFGDKVPVLDGGACKLGVESTVVRWGKNTTVEILRRGAVPVEDISSACESLGIAFELNTK